MIGTIFECAFNKFGLFLLQNGIMVRGDTKVVDAINAQRVSQEFPHFVPPVVGVSAAVSQIYFPQTSSSSSSSQGWDQKPIRTSQNQLGDLDLIPPNELRIYVYDRDKPFIYENCFCGK